MLFEPSFLGRAGFYWFVGVVENRLDPLKSGRVRVRCKAIHTADKTELPTDTLIWSNVSTPPTSASTSGVGETPKLLEGTWVWGFFLDGIENQESVICGTWIGIQNQKANPNYGFNDPRTDFSGYPQKISVTYASDGSGSTFTNAPIGSYPRTDRLDEPDTSRLARNDSAFPADQNVNKTASRQTQLSVPIAGGGTWSEPNFYNTTYPFNQVKESESGHAFEFDDTPGAERVHLYHRTGSFIETGPDGSVIDKSVQDKYDITQRNFYGHVNGNWNLTIGQNANLLVQGGNFTISLSGNSLKIIGDIELEGGIIATGDIVAGSATTAAPSGPFVSLMLHTTSGVTSGSGTSGPPVPGT